MYQRLQRLGWLSAWLMACTNLTAIADAQVGSVSFTVLGLLEGTSALLSVDNEPFRVTQNGKVALPLGLAPSAHYSVGITTQPKGQTCTLHNAEGNAYDATFGVSMNCERTLRFNTLRAATQELGAPDFNSALAQPPATASAMWLPWGRVYKPDDANMLFVAELQNNRVLALGWPVLQNGAAADYVFGQHDSFSSNGNNTGRDSLDGPAAVSGDGNVMAIVDFRNNRVLLFSKTLRTDDLPTGVMGQVDFAANRADCHANTLFLPSDVLFVKGKLVVTDHGNNRVLIWNLVAENARGPDADVVLGQVNFDSCAYNRTNDSAVAPAADTLKFPQQSSFNAGIFYVGDTHNHRVLMWNGMPTRTGAPADWVLGQPDMTSNNPGAAANRFTFPKALVADAAMLFVADTENNRVLAFPLSNGRPADAAAYVLGQANMTDNAPNRAPDSPYTAVTSTTLYGPTGLTFVGPNLVVSDTRNSRVLIFESD